MQHLPLVFVDLEGTGLPVDSPDGSTDWPLPLEIALVHVDAELKIQHHVSHVIRWPMWQVTERMQPEALAMHQANGLLDHVPGAPLVLEAVEHACLTFLAEGRAENLYMAGSGLTYDRRMLSRWFPALAKKFHYRNVDLTTLRYFFGDAKLEAAHRALADCMQSLELLRGYVARARECGLLPHPVTV